MGRPPTRHPVAVPILVALTALLGGCVGNTDTTASPVESFALTPSTVFQGTYALPLDSILAPPKVETDAIRNAAFDAISVCMSAQGLEFSTRSDYTPGSQTGAYYGVTNPDEAARFGYRPPWLLGQENNDAATGTGESGTSANTVDAAYDVALYGNEADRIQVKDESTGAIVANYDPNSCFGQAMDTFQPQWGQMYSIEDTAMQISLETHQASYEDPEVQQGFHDWSTCMADAGYEFATPDDAYYSVWPGDTPGAQEIGTATADATCKVDTQLNETWSSVLARLRLEALAAHPGIITQWTQIHQAQLDAVGGSAS